MYSIGDLGNICVWCLLIFVVLGVLGLREAWSMVAALAAIVFVAVMLNK